MSLDRRPHELETARISVTLAALTTAPSAAIPLRVTEEDLNAPAAGIATLRRQQPPSKKAPRQRISSTPLLTPPPLRFSSTSHNRTAPLRFTRPRRCAARSE